MKKILLLFLMVVFLSNLNAQDEGSGSLFGKFYIGAKAGYGISNFESTVKSEKDFAKMTYDNISYGIVAGIELTNRLCIQVEGNYAQYGAKEFIPNYIYSPTNPLFVSYNPNTTVDHVDMDLFYADIPLTLRYSLTDGDFAPYLYGGLNWGINMSGNATIVRKFIENDVTIYREFRNDITGQIKYNDFSPVVGAGVKINMGSLSLLGDVRYKHGLNNISNVNNSLGFTNNSLYVSAGLVLNL
jgi:hypothetical protein